MVGRENGDAPKGSRRVQSALAVAVCACACVCVSNGSRCASRHRDGSDLSAYACEYALVKCGVDMHAWLPWDGL